MQRHGNQRLHLREPIFFRKFSVQFPSHPCHCADVSVIFQLPDHLTGDVFIATHGGGAAEKAPLVSSATAAGARAGGIGSKFIAAVRALPPADSRQRGPAGRAKTGTVREDRARAAADAILRIDQVEQRPAEMTRAGGQSPEDFSQMLS